MANVEEVKSLLRLIESEALRVVPVFKKKQEYLSRKLHELKGAVDTGSDKPELMSVNESINMMDKVLCDVPNIIANANVMGTMAATTLISMESSPRFAERVANELDIESLTTTLKSLQSIKDFDEEPVN